MDPVTIGTTVVTLLAPYVADAGKELVKAVGEAGVERAKALLQTLRSRLAGDPLATRDLERFEKDPTTYAPGLQETIAARAQEDPAFSSEIEKQLDGAGPIVEIIQQFTHAKNLTGADVETAAAGSFSIAQKGETADDVTGFKAKTVRR
jgi:hypothetical protein